MNEVDKNLLRVVREYAEEYDISDVDYILDLHEAVEVLLEIIDGLAYVPPTYEEERRSGHERRKAQEPRG
jgi:hypothetical protein